MEAELSCVSDAWCRDRGGGCAAGGCLGDAAAAADVDSFANGSVWRTCKGNCGTCNDEGASSEGVRPPPLALSERRRCTSPSTVETADHRLPPAAAAGLVAFAAAAADVVVEANWWFCEAEATGTAEATCVHACSPPQLPGSPPLAHRRCSSTTDTAAHRFSASATHSDHSFPGPPAESIGTPRYNEANKRSRVSRMLTNLPSGKHLEWVAPRVRVSYHR
jgi:hypothetical protein